jgi:hypothetical protein
VKAKTRKAKRAEFTFLLIGLKAKCGMLFIKNNPQSKIQNLKSKIA